MILYLDTSALMKFLLTEAGSPEAIASIRRADLVASSVITYTETCAALGRRLQGSANEGEVLAEHMAALDEMWGAFTRIPVRERPAGRLAITHRLRGMDAVQLQAAVDLRGRFDGGTAEAMIVFAAFDRDLLKAAEREGFATLGGDID